MKRMTRLWLCIARWRWTSFSLFSAFRIKRKTFCRRTSKAIPIFCNLLELALQKPYPKSNLTPNQRPKSTKIALKEDWKKNVLTDGLIYPTLLKKQPPRKVRLCISTAEWRTGTYRRRRCATHRWNRVRCVEKQTSDRSGTKRPDIFECIDADLIRHSAKQCSLRRTMPLTCSLLIQQS